MASDARRNKSPAILITCDPRTQRDFVRDECTPFHQYHVFCCRDLAGLPPGASAVSRVVAYVDAFISWLVRHANGRDLLGAFASEVSSTFAHLAAYIDRDRHNGGRCRSEFVDSLTRRLREIDLPNVHVCKRINSAADSAAYLFLLDRTAVSSDLWAVIEERTGPFVDFFAFDDFTLVSHPLAGADNALWGLKPAWPEASTVNAAHAVAALSQCVEWSHGTRSSWCFVLDDWEDTVRAVTESAKGAGAFFQVDEFSSASLETAAHWLTEKASHSDAPPPAIAFASTDPTRGPIVIARLAAAATLLGSAKVQRNFRCFVYFAVQARSLEALDRRFSPARIRASVAETLYQGSRLSEGFPTSVRIESAEPWASAGRSSGSQRAPPGAVVIGVQVEWGDFDLLDSKYMALLREKPVVEEEVVRAGPVGSVAQQPAKRKWSAADGHPGADEDRAAKRTRSIVLGGGTAEPPDVDMEGADGRESPLYGSKMGPTRAFEPRTPVSSAVLSSESGAHIGSPTAQVPRPRVSLDVHSSPAGPAEKKSSISVTPSSNTRRQAVPVDEHGVAKVPFKIGKITFQNMGTIVWDKPGFHNEHYIYPVGFTTIKVYDPSHKMAGTGEEYKNEIVDNGDKPLFVVTRLSDNEKWDGPTVTSVWTKVVRSMRDESKDDSGAPPKNVSGPSYFGFGDQSFPQIKKYIEGMPNADKCEKYWRHRKLESAAPGPATAAPTPKETEEAEEEAGE